jgi:hypothetical protein
MFEESYRSFYMKIQVNSGECYIHTCFGVPILTLTDAHKISCWQKSVFQLARYSIEKPTTLRKVLYVIATMAI